MTRKKKHEANCDENEKKKGRKYERLFDDREKLVSMTMKVVEY